jgi:AcrR family transcriptional regulator
MADRRSRPRAGLTREKVLDAALELVDTHGLPALSMRKLGAGLGVEAMTLYHYFPSKAALLDSLVERVFGLALTEAPADDTAEWTDWLHQFARSMRTTLLRHPGALTLVATRPASTPEALRTVERALSRLRAAGLSLGRSMDVINSVATFVVGHTLAEVGQTPGHEGTEPDPDHPDAPLDAVEFPNFTEVLATRAGLDFDSRFETTLRILLTGYAALP